jgi:hypothetical protein
MIQSDQDVTQCPVISAVLHLFGKTIEGEKNSREKERGDRGRQTIKRAVVCWPLLTAKDE